MLALSCSVKAFVSTAQTRPVGSRLFSRQKDLNVGIVGGGLAGLATAYHLIQKNPTVDITIIDKAPPGTSGASSVAGG
jgi:aspartate oxidase